MSWASLVKDRFSASEDLRKGSRIVRTPQEESERLEWLKSRYLRDFHPITKSELLTRIPGNLQCIVFDLEYQQLICFATQVERAIEEGLLENLNVFHVYVNDVDAFIRVEKHGLDRLQLRYNPDCKPLLAEILNNASEKIPESLRRK
jgi:hypothetical protein